MVSNDVVTMAIVGLPWGGGHGVEGEVEGEAEGEAQAFDGPCNSCKK